MRLQLKRSNVLASGSAKTPTASQLEYGELAINYNTDDPAIFLKDSNNNVIRISGVGNIADDGQVELPATTTPPSNPQSGNLWYNSDDGRLYIYYTDADSSQWVDASPDSWDPTVLPDTTNSSSQSGTLDDRYLMLNSGNDPVTGGLNITGGNVGVGTSNPASELEVNGFIQSSSGLKFNDIDSNYGLFPSGSETLTFYINGSERARINNSGYLGIMTTSPIAQLTARGINAGGQGGTMCIQNTGNGVNTNVALYLTPNNGGGNDLQRSASIKSRQDVAGNYANLEFYTSASSTPTERMRITSSGNVGVGTTNPSYKLDVEGGSSSVQFSSATNWNFSNVNIRRKSSNVGTAKMISMMLDGDSASETNLTNNLNIWGTYSGTPTTSSTSSALNGAMNLGAPEAILFHTNGSERARVNSAGYLGINVTSPAYHLDVQGYGRFGETSGLGLIQLGKSSTTSNNYHIGADSAGGFQIWNGNIGSGVTKMTVASNGDLTTFGNIKVRGNDIEGGHIAVQNPNRTDTGAHFDVSGADNPRWFSVRNNPMFQIGQFSGTGGNIRFYTSGAQRAKIETNGHYLIHQDTSSVPGAGNQTTGACFERANDGTTLFVSRSSATPCFINRNSTGDLVAFHRNGYQHGRVIANNNGTVSYATNSDYRLKENVVVLDNAIDRVKQLLPKRFNFLGTPDEVVDGFLAHEAQTVVPEAVEGTHDQTEPIGTLTEWDGTVLETDVVEPDDLTWEEGITDEDGNQSIEIRTRTWTQTGTKPVYQSIDQAKLVPLLTAALQEAIARIEALENA